MLYSRSFSKLFLRMKYGLVIFILFLSGCDTFISSSSQNPTEQNEPDSTSIASLEPPKEIEVTPKDGEVVLSWSPAQEAESYTVYFSTVEGTAESGVPITGIVETTYTHSGLTNTTEYFYAIRSVGIGGVESEASVEVSATPLFIPPPPNARTVYFEEGSDVVRSSQRSVLESHVSFLKDNSVVSVIVKGHADDPGTDEYNFELSGDRAKAVQDYLQIRGVPTSQISREAFGNTEPDPDAESSPDNRRVELSYDD